MNQASSGIKIQIDELDAEMSYEGWVGFKSKVMGAMLSNKILWEEGVAMRSLIDSQLEKHSKRYNEFKMDTRSNG